MAKVTAIIPCAGQGKRMDTEQNKPFLLVLDKPILAYTLDIFQKHPLIDQILLVVRREEIDYCQKEIVDKYQFDKVKKIVAGGQERQESVYFGLLSLDEDTELVVVHDGVRPLVSAGIIEQVIQKALETTAAIVAVPVKDTIKEVHLNNVVEQTLPRERLWQVQTPQVFDKKLLLKAYGEALKTGFMGTDDASLVERLAVSVSVVKGSYLNIKITTPEDLILVEEWIRMKKDANRIRL